MIHPVFYLILSYLFIGSIITHLTNAKAASSIGKKRWTKVGIYLLITVGLVCSILYTPNFFLLLNLVIVALGLREIIGLQLLRNKFLKNIFGVVSIVIYMLITVLFLWFVFQYKVQPDYLLFWFVLVFTFDSFSQLTGQLLGQKLLFPQTSPNKTVEGLVGGLLVTLVTAMFIHQWINSTIMESFFLGFLISIGSLTGDYLASFYKRKYTVKDFNELIPAHGGILDRFDSFIFSGAVLGVLYLL